MAKTWIEVRQTRDPIAGTWWSADLIEGKRDGSEAIVGTITIGRATQAKCESAARAKWPEATAIRVYTLDMQEQGIDV